MAKFVSLWLFILCGTIGVGVAGYCFRGDIPTEPFLITDFVEDAINSCRSCGIDATRASTSLAREQLDLAMFFANSSLNCLCFLNDVHMTPELWHKGGELATIFPHLTRAEDNNTVVYFPWADRSGCMTSPSNFSLTSNPVLAFTKETFKYTSLRVAHGFAFTDSGNVDEKNALIFDSLQLDNLFEVAAPWKFYSSFPLDLRRLGFGLSWGVGTPGTLLKGLGHNTVMYGFVNSSDETVAFLTGIPNIFADLYTTDRNTLLGYDMTTSIAFNNVDCGTISRHEFPEDLLECVPRNNQHVSCFTKGNDRLTNSTRISEKGARECFLDQADDEDLIYGFIPAATTEFLRNSVCASGNSSNENEPCPIPLDICEAAKCCLKTDPLTLQQTCVYRAVSTTSPANATTPLLAADLAGKENTTLIREQGGSGDNGGNYLFVILAALGGATICIIALFGLLKFDAKNRSFHFRSFRLRKVSPVLGYPSSSSRYYSSGSSGSSTLKLLGTPECSRRFEKIDIVLGLSGGKPSNANLEAFRESKRVFLRNVDDFLLGITSNAAHVETVPGLKQADELEKVDINNRSISDGSVTETKGIIKGKNSTYYKIKELHSGCQSSCFLVSKKADDGGDSFFVAKMYSSFEASEQAISEAFILGQARHANILEIVETFAYEGTLVIVTRFCELGDLGSLIGLSQTRGVVMDETWILEVFVQICLALRHLHKACIIHRDLKPKNIFMDAHGAVKIGDFGLSTLTTTFAETIVGTPFYMAPEIHQGKPYSFSSDVWSLGIILYFLCTYTMPFNANTHKELEEKKNVGSYKAMTGYSEGLVDIVSQMLHLDPTKRPTAEEILGSPFLREFMTNLRKHIAVTIS